MAGGNPEETTQAAGMLNSAAIHLLRALRAVDRSAEVTPARLSALSVLVFGGPCTLGALADTEGVAQPTMTRIVDGLVRLELARRAPHPDSARMVLIEATPAGVALMTAARQRRLAVIREALETLAPAQRTLVVRAAPALFALSGAVQRQVDGEPFD